MRSLRTAFGGLTIGLVSLATVVQAATPVKVVDTSGYEFGSAAGGSWLAWSRGASYRGDHDLVVKEQGQPADVVELGRYQQVGNIEIGGDHGDILVFDFQRLTGEHDIRFYDLATGTMSEPPAGINTDKDDEFVSISGNHLLFSRGPVGGTFSRKVYLYDFTTTDSTLLSTAPPGGTANADSISGDYATYTRCPSSGECDVFRYQISTQLYVPMPDGGRATYWSSVLEDGTVYFVQGHPSECGRRTKIMRYAPDGTVTRLFRFANGIEIADLDAVEEPKAIEVYFTRVRCSGLPGIWKIDG